MTHEVVPPNEALASLPAARDFDAAGHMSNTVYSAEMFRCCTACDKLPAFTAALTVKAHSKWAAIILGLPKTSTFSQRRKSKEAYSLIVCCLGRIDGSDCSRECTASPRQREANQNKCLTTKATHLVAGSTPCSKFPLSGEDMSGGWTRRRNSGFRCPGIRQSMISYNL